MTDALKARVVREPPAVPGRRLRVALAGTGMIAAVHRRAAILAGAEVVGVLGSRPERSRQAARRWGLPAAFTSLADLAGSPADVVHVCTPNATHAPYAEALLAAGKHVVCEKPLGVSLAEAERMHALAQRAGVVATVPFVYRYHPVVREIRARAMAGQYGCWNLLHGHYLQDWLLSPAASSWRVDPAQGGPSRAFADIGSHWCDLVEWVSGERLDTLTAQVSVAVPERPVPPEDPSGGGRPAAVRTEDVATVLFRSAAGVPGSMLVSQVAAGRKNRLWFELDGSVGSAVFDQENPESFWTGTAEGGQAFMRASGYGSAEQRRLSYSFGPRERDQTLALLEETGLQLSAFAYYENNLHPDPARREQIAAHLRHAIDAARLLGVSFVGTFIGRDPSRSVVANQHDAEKVFPPLVDYAGERGVKLIIENCVMEGWHPDGYPGNIAYSPELWEWMFSLGLYLNWDPSHLTWIGIDPVETIRPYISHILHAQAKDVELDERARNRFGCFGIVDKGADPWKTGWWRYRVPGRGQVDWARVVDRLYEAGFGGVLSVEHEDPVWGGTETRVVQGLRIAQQTLRPLIVPDPGDCRQNRPGRGALRS